MGFTHSRGGYISVFKEGNTPPGHPDGSVGLVFAYGPLNSEVYFVNDDPANPKFRFFPPDATSGGKKRKSMKRRRMKRGKRTHRRR